MPEKKEKTLNKLKNKLMNQLLEKQKNAINDNYPNNTNDSTKMEIEENKNNTNNTNDLLLKEQDFWRIGILCKKDCYYITMEILKCLKRHGYEWKLISSSYKIKCRKKAEDDNNGNSSSNNKVLNVLIQIFSVSIYFN